MAVMSVQQMREAIESGQSVSWRGRILRHVNDLPTEAENAGTEDELVQARDAARKRLEGEQVALHDIEQRLADLREQRATEARATQAADAARRGVTEAARKPPAARTPATPPGPTGTTGGAATGGEPEFAGRPLSHYRRLVVGAADDEEALDRLQAEEGVGEATARKIQEALAGDGGKQ